MNKINKQLYLDIYNTAHKNAFDLFKEAKLLHENSHFARAYALAYTALEEISKSQFAADVYTGLQTPEDFKEFFMNHKKKIARMKWAHIDANSYAYNLKWIGPNPDDMKKIKSDEPIFKKRLLAMYVDVDFENSKLTEPKKTISEKDAKEILHIVEVALERIWEMTEHWGHQIGTKGFMK